MRSWFVFVRDQGGLDLRIKENYLIGLDAHTMGRFALSQLERGKRHIFRVVQDP